MIQMNNWKRPRLTRQERKLLRNCNNQERRHKPRKIQKAKIITWAIVDVRMQRQIDYILINQRFRVSVRFAETVTGWVGNVRQSRQRNVAQMNIALAIMKTTTLKKPHGQEQKRHMAFTECEKCQKTPTVFLNKPALHRGRNGASEKRKHPMGGN